MTTYVDFDSLFEGTECLGKGGQGQVCKVFTKEAFTGFPKGTPLAVKLIRVDTLNETQLEDLESEIASLKRLSSNSNNGCHKNILCYYDSLNVIKDNVGYKTILTEFIDGYSLEDYITSLLREVEGEEPVYAVSEQLTQKQIANLMKQLLETLDYIHIAGLIHRDIKPPNIMYVPKDFIMKYIDFGFSCFDVLGNISHQCELKYRGTPRYIAPEIWNLPEGVRPIENSDDVEKLRKADIWMLGLCFYELVYGVNPYEGADDIREIIVEVTSPTPVQFYESDVDPYLVNVISLMVDKNYKKRPTARKLYNMISAKYPNTL